MIKWVDEWVESCEVVIENKQTKKNKRGKYKGMQKVINNKHNTELQWTDPGTKDKG